MKVRHYTLLECNWFHYRVKELCSINCILGGEEKGFRLKAPVHTIPMQNNNPLNIHNRIKCRIIKGVVVVVDCTVV